MAYTFPAKMVFTKIDRWQPHRTVRDHACNPRKVNIHGRNDSALFLHSFFSSRRLFLSSFQRSMETSTRERVLGLPSVSPPLSSPLSSASWRQPIEILELIDDNFNIDKKFATRSCLDKSRRNKASELIKFKKNS